MLRVDLMNILIKKTMRIALIAVATIPHLLWGCATTSLPTSNDFNSAVVPHIQMGVTTESQILKWLGEPYYKKPLTETEMIWLYSWSRPAADLSVVPFGHRNIGTTGLKKILWLYIRNNIVVTYTYEEKVL